MDPSDLFNTGFNVADVNANHGDEGARVQGFLEAAEHMAARMAKNRGAIDIEIYPALYLYRHGLELGFKAILVTMDYENNQTQNRYHHRLQELWTELEPQLDDPVFGGDAAQHLLDDAVDYMGKAVAVVDSVDPDGESVRYDKNKKGKETMPSVSTVNLDVFVDMCRRSNAWMLAVLEHRLQIDNHLKHQRGHFKV